MTTVPVTPHTNSGDHVKHMAEEIDHAKHLLRKCTHEMQDLLKEWDKVPHAQRMKSVDYIIRELSGLRRHCKSRANLTAYISLRVALLLYWLSTFYSSSLRHEKRDLN